MGGREAQTLHVLFFPLMAPGHMNPMIDMAKLFAAQGVKVTILTTPANAATIQPTIGRANDSDRHHRHPIAIVLIPFPSAAAGLPEGCENLSSVPSKELQPKFLKSLVLLRQPFDQVLGELLPDCVVTDSFQPWTYSVAAGHGVLRLSFYGTSFFAFCAAHSLEHHKPLESLPLDVESFVFPGLPHRIEMLRSQIPDFTKSEFASTDIFNQIRESERKSFGIVVNSFYELEPDYAEHYRKVVGRKAWGIGPVSLCNKDEADMSRRGNKASIDGDTCSKWLDGKNPGSVVYVSFGSLSEFTMTQLREIALGLEASSCPFIWVVRNAAGDWLPENYEERIEGRGLIIRGWAPQILILNHRAVGGFVTHCGWNSTLEGVSAGLPMVTWPLFADQFYNERLVVDLLAIGVSIGAKEYVVSWQEDRPVTGAAEIERAVGRLMESGEEAEGRRRRARELGEKARSAVEEGGSSFLDMVNLIKELTYIPAAIETEKV